MSRLISINQTLFETVLSIGTKSNRLLQSTTLLSNLMIPHIYNNLFRTVKQETT